MEKIMGHDSSASFPSLVQLQCKDSGTIYLAKKCFASERLPSNQGYPDLQATSPDLEARLCLLFLIHNSGLIFSVNKASLYGLLIDDSYVSRTSSWACHAMAWQVLLQHLEVEKAGSTYTFSPSGLDECMILVSNFGHGPVWHMTDIRPYAKRMKRQHWMERALLIMSYFALCGQCCRLQTRLCEELTSATAETTFSVVFIFSGLT